ncbi:phage replisome organizer N-terminal domain-containing protein [Streptococcus parasuis]|uniref:phage replisome organizer N-terminal domain-containing protein n=1 Tax=Streptococcus parasuis TaxID=1501662 RepID=UPI00289A511D|nr:phage replisome organizer N-terminal domain-containing protein [Streptococcus parasuis]
MALKENKRYYWLQLKEDFFTSKEMKLLRRLPGGNEHTIIYLKIMLASLQDGGKIYFENLGHDLAEEISLLIDEDIEAVRMTLLFLTNKQLLTTKDKFEFQLEQVPELIGSETASTRRSRKYRDMQKALQCNTDATECNGDIDIDIDIKKDIDIEREIERDKKSLVIISEIYQSKIGVIDGDQFQQLTEYVTIDGMEIDVVIRAISEAADNGKRNFKYILAILRNWKQNGIKTTVQVEERERQRIEQKVNYSNNGNNSQPQRTNVPTWSTEPVSTEQTTEGQAKLAELFAELEAMEGADD